MPTLIIGKVPGYNEKINPGTDNPVPIPGQILEKKSIDYTERLKNNLTTVTLKPTGYKINYDKAIGEAINAAEATTPAVLNTAGDIITEATEAIGVNLAGLNSQDDSVDLNQLYTIGRQETNSILGTFGALNAWTNIVKSTLSGMSNKFTTNDKAIDTIKILCTNDSTMTEVFNNSYGTSTAEELANSFSNVSGADTLKKISKAPTMLSSLGGLEMLKIGSKVTNNQLLTLLAGKALGIQTALPKEWKKSDYSNSLQLMIKLVSPSGHEDDIHEFILKPLTFLIMSGSPVSSDGINFGYPTIWEVEAEGMMDMRLGAISAMTITRGGNETQFNRFNQPLNVDVRLTIEPLISSFATTINSSYNMEDMMVTNPYYLKTSLDPDNSNYQTINL